jgi:hypothetical protein
LVDLVDFTPIDAFIASLEEEMAVAAPRLERH